MSPRLLSRITGMPGCAAWMCAISRCSASSAPSAAKWAICGLNAQAKSAVASTMSRQKSNTASGSLGELRGELRRLRVEADAHQRVGLGPARAQCLHEFIRRFLRGVSRTSVLCEVFLVEVFHPRRHALQVHPGRHPGESRDPFRRCLSMVASPLQRSTTATAQWIPAFAGMTHRQSRPRHGAAGPMRHFSALNRRRCGFAPSSPMRRFLSSSYSR